MVHLSWITVAFLSVLLSPASCSRDQKPTLNLVRRHLVQYLNGDRFLQSVRKKGLSSRECPSRTSPEPKPNPSFDVFSIGDLKFSVPIRTAAGLRKRKVFAECGFLLGLSDFKPFASSSSPSEGSTRPSYTELWFRWSNLRAKCLLSTAVDGLKSTGESYVLVKPLYMLVRRETSVDPPFTQVEMTMSKEATVSLVGLGALPSEQQDAIRVQLEARVVCIVNSHVRDVLRNYVESSFRNRTASFMSKLIYQV